MKVFTVRLSLGEKNSVSYVWVVMVRNLLEPNLGTVRNVANTKITLAE